MPEISGIPPIWTRDDVVALLDHVLKRPYRFLINKREDGDYEALYGSGEKTGQTFLKTSPATEVVLYDDDETFWEEFKEGDTGSWDVVLTEDLVNKISGTSCLKVSITSGIRDVVGFEHNFASSVDWSQKDGLRIYFNDLGSIGDAWYARLLDVNGNYYEWVISLASLGAFNFIALDFLLYDSKSDPPLDLSKVKTLRFYLYPSTTGEYCVDKSTLNTFYSKIFNKVAQALTSNRTYVENILVIGDFFLDTRLQLKAFTEFDFQHARLFQPNNNNFPGPLIEPLEPFPIETQAGRPIIIKCGVLDGNSDNNLLTQPIKISAPNTTVEFGVVRKCPKGILVNNDHCAIRHVLFEYIADWCVDVNTFAIVTEYYVENNQFWNWIKGVRIGPRGKVRFNELHVTPFGPSICFELIHNNASLEFNWSDETTPENTFCLLTDASFSRIFGNKTEDHKYRFVEVGVCDYNWYYFNELHTFVAGDVAFTITKRNSVVRNNWPYNPSGLISTPFLNTSPYGISPFLGTAASPTSGRTYKIYNQDVYIFSSGGSTDISIYDSKGTLVSSGETSLNRMFVIGYQIKWTGVPTTLRVFGL